MMSLCVIKFQYKIFMKHHDHISSQSTSYEIWNRCIMSVEFIQIYLHFFCHSSSVWIDLGFWISYFFRYKLKYAVTLWFTVKSLIVTLTKHAVRYIFNSRLDYRGSKFGGFVKNLRLVERILILVTRQHCGFMTWCKTSWIRTAFSASSPKTSWIFCTLLHLQQHENYAHAWIQRSAGFIPWFHSMTIEIWCYSSDKEQKNILITDYL